MSREQEEAAKRNLEQLYEKYANKLRKKGKQVTPELLAEKISDHFQMNDPHWVVGPAKKWLSRQDWFQSDEKEDKSMSEQEKRPAWTMTVLTPEQVQALKEKEAEEAVRQRDELDEIIRKQRYEDGWNAYVESPTRIIGKGTHYEAYMEGWNAAKAQEEVYGVIPFLLDELKKRMEAGDEWYGCSFDGSLQIVEKIQAAYEAEKQESPLQG